ncbi:BYPASS-related protein [Tanacetum coccineum]
MVWRWLVTTARGPMAPAVVSLARGSSGLLLQEKIGKDWIKKEKKGRSRLLDETQRLEKLGLSLVEFADGISFLVEAEKRRKWLQWWPRWRRYAGEWMKD